MILFISDHNQDIFQLLNLVFLEDLNDDLKFVSYIPQC